MQQQDGGVKTNCEGVGNTLQWTCNECSNVKCHTDWVEDKTLEGFHGAIYLNEDIAVAGAKGE